jgi:magnesium-transporting ATPase (P-type)
VPGDIYIPEEPADVPADCVVAFGDVYVNEANLTG